ncbi:inosine-uridine preferring nucleoside hydrolase [Aspergillus campestris IBT 28561]|uniref:Inosine-uridine preferring nucleoside hydrolase n=1 Tax=Aspergillus campestris (strain IBT 28561) TaxID=1392248 RepID=A0A2I1CVN8_ASPC2|nr:inosine-uridine preferring nucleoside hydrolase [Aspergillus campestris IBT 28561]PKY01689.1 inosine-uridine preferring nucleoside hydrolase [Aspergillus campestris IBT 28561]
MWVTRSLAVCSLLVSAVLGSASSTSASPSASSSTQKAQEKRYAILDNDWGAVSFIPILLALKGDMEILGLASNTANTWQRQSALHALANLELSNLTCIPVIPGCTWPLLHTPHRFHTWESLHGALPWQGAFAPEAQDGNDPTSGDPNRIVREAFIEGFPRGSIDDSKTAAMFMVDMVRKYPGQVSIYSAGALTNVALAVRLDESFARNARELVVMGGYVDVNLLQVRGSVELANENSDINLMIDPESAKIAFNAPFPEIVIAGNVANQVPSTQSFLDDVHEVRNPLTNLFHDHYGTEFPFWDETAAAIMVDRGVVLNATTAYIDVDIAYGSPNYGNIHVYQKALMPPGLRNVTYVHRVDGERVKAMMKDAMQDPPSC